MRGSDGATSRDCLRESRGQTSRSPIQNAWRYCLGLLLPGSTDDPSGPQAQLQGLQSLHEFHDETSIRADSDFQLSDGPKTAARSTWNEAKAVQGRILQGPAILCL